MCSQPKNQTFSASNPLVTFVHSTSTVPLKSLSSRGRRTTTRVRYGWPPSMICAWSSRSAGVVYRFAVPSMKNSCSM